MSAVASGATASLQRGGSPVLTIAGGRTLPAVLSAGARRTPQQPLLIFESADGAVLTWTWAEVDEQSRRVASLLTEHGVARGDRVHLHLANRPEFLFAWFAVAYLGASIVPTNVAASPHELAYVLGHAGARLSVTDAAGRDAVAAARQISGVAGALLDCDRGELAASAHPPLDADACAARSGDELAVMYTSGTTANPKGVLLTHANYVYAGEVVAAALRLDADDRFLTVLPLFHANAQNYSTMGTLIGGGTIVLMARFSASRLLSQAARHRATLASLFAAPMRMLLAQTPTPDWRAHALRTVIFAQNLTPEEYAAWDARVGAPLLQLYGMTETVGPPVMNPLVGERHHDAIGRPVLGYGCRVVREDGSEAAVGEPGELLISGVPGVSLMAGYLDDAAATAAAFADGWLWTGDVVSADADGFLRFVDRQKDMIKRAGENVAASEVEAVLLAHPGVRDAAVVGVPDPMRDEQIVAFVVLSPAGDADPAVSPEALIVWCAARLARFRVPSVVECCNALPRTAVGKIQKHDLRQRYLERADQG
jgi:crotonobetaine/carnitine-CoA ligase